MRVSQLLIHAARRGGICRQQKSRRLWETPSNSIPSGRTPSDSIPSDKIPSDRILSDRIPGNRIPSERVPSDGARRQRKVRWDFHLFTYR